MAPTSSPITLLDAPEVKLIDSMASDLSVTRSAQVSVKGENKPDTDTPRLINYLMSSRHGSPFEHATFTWFVKAPIFTFREFQRHRIASYNEMSGRYTKLNPEFYLPKEDRPLLQIGKPGAYTFLPGTEGQKADVHYKLVDIAEQAWAAYEHLLEADVAKEVSRAVLPVSIYSQMYCTMNLRALMNFLSLRTKTKENSAVPSFPQHEISLGADKLEEIFKNNFPWTHEAWEANGRLAP